MGPTDSHSKHLHGAPRKLKYLQWHLRRLLNSAQRAQITLGFLLSLFFPAVFVAAQPVDLWVGQPFLYTFLAIFAMWMVNFTLVDFHPYSTNRNLLNKWRLYWRISMSFSISLVIYIVLASLDKSNVLLGTNNPGGLSVLSGFYLILRILLFNSVFLLLKYLYDSRHAQRQWQGQIESLRRDNLRAINESLKNQISPHFLFNSLTTLKSLIRQDDKERPLVFVDELATVYRYMLAHHSNEMVQLVEEINFAKSYLALMKIRFGASLRVHLEIPDRMLDSTMPPTTLQILLENAMKHNVITSDRPLDIMIYTKGPYLAVENSLQPKRTVSHSSHVGLSNITRRYRILKGTDIIVEKNESTFRVLLPLTE